MNRMDYELIDSGNGRKLERFGAYCLERPCSQAVWHVDDKKIWTTADAGFSRAEHKGWDGELPGEWLVTVEGLQFQLKPTPFGHLGIFPEHRRLWRWVADRIRRPLRLLNLFAYSGGLTLAAARAGAEVCHLDASRGMVDWARHNAALNGLAGAPIRWLVDDAVRFVQREERRGQQYDAIILDPPTFGRGNRGQVFKIERELPRLLASCRQLLSAQPQFVILSCHTPGFGPWVLRHLLEQMMRGIPGELEQDELLLSGQRPIPSGAFAIWRLQSRCSRGGRAPIGRRRAAGAELPKERQGGGRPPRPEELPNR